MQSEDDSDLGQEVSDLFKELEGSREKGAETNIRDLVHSLKFTPESLTVDRPAYQHEKIG